MRSYIIRRFLFLIPSLAALTIVSFIFLHVASGDVAGRMLISEGIYENAPSQSQTDIAIQNDLRIKLGLDQPLFYFSVISLSQKRNSALMKSEMWMNYFPVIIYNSHNQFNSWFRGDGINTRGIIHGDFGISWTSNEPVSAIIKSRIGWSLFFSTLSVILACLISIPSGIKSAMNPDSGKVRFINGIFTMLYSLPAFWIATLLMFLFCNPDFINILPSGGVAPAGGFDIYQSFGYKIIHTLPYLVLPTICYTYGSIAFMSRSVNASITEEINKDYVTTARAKGLNEKQIIKRHVLRNALLPLITIISHVFPFAIAGSVILETIFTIPGMGLSIYHSILAQDFPVIIAVFMITGFITITGFFLSDVLYAIADPRISYSETTA